MNTGRGTQNKNGQSFLSPFHEWDLNTGPNFLQLGSEYWATSIHTILNPIKIYDGDLSTEASSWTDIQLVPSNLCHQFLITPYGKLATPLKQNKLCLKNQSLFTK